VSQVYFVFVFVFRPSIHASRLSTRAQKYLELVVAAHAQEFRRSPPKGPKNGAGTISQICVHGWPRSAYPQRGFETRRIRIGCAHPASVVIVVAWREEGHRKYVFWGPFAQPCAVRSARGRARAVPDEMREVRDLRAAQREMRKMQSLGRARDAYCAVHERLRVLKRNQQRRADMRGHLRGLRANEDAQRDRRVHQRLFAKRLKRVANDDKIPAAASVELLNEQGLLTSDPDELVRLWSNQYMSVLGNPTRVCAKNLHRMRLTRTSPK
jgi:hypothetical protein